MGLLDNLWGGLRNAAGQGGGDLPGALMSLLGGSSGQAGQTNGLASLVQRFDHAGLGDIARSWVSNQQANQPVTPDQVHSAIGDDHVQALASQTGMPQTALLGALAAMLPKLVDAMTPNGQVPATAGNVQPQPAPAPGEAEAPSQATATDPGDAVQQTDPTEPVQTGRRD